MVESEAPKKSHSTPQTTIHHTVAYILKQFTDKVNIQFVYYFIKFLAFLMKRTTLHCLKRQTRTLPSGKVQSHLILSNFSRTFYAHGSAALGMRTPVKRYCSHKNHLPSLPRIRSFIGRGSSAPPHGIKSFIYPSSAAET